MNLKNMVVVLAAAGLAALVGLFAERYVSPRYRGIVRWVLAGAAVALFFFAIGKYVEDSARAVDLSKVAIAVAAAGAIFYEQLRAGIRRPVAERWKRFVGVSLGIAAILAYFNGLKFDFPDFIHRHDVFHYYLGAKYFPEMGYDGLYSCTAIAQDELGTVEWKDSAGQTFRVDLSKEVRRPERKLRNLGKDNLLVPATAALEHPEECKSHFTDARWSAYKADVLWFRESCGNSRDFWEKMQNDHGFNPPPAWMILGRFFSELHPATTGYLEALSFLDIAFLAGMFGALWWAFGWRVTAIGAIFWGCQGSAPFMWNGAAFLRQDWLFFLVLSTCLLKKKHFKLAGAAFAYTTLLRVFPGLVCLGFVVVVVATTIRKRALDPSHRGLILGGVLATGALVSVSIAVTNPHSYEQFYRHTIEIHDQTPLTNDMGLRVLIAHKLGSDYKSGRMKYVMDDKLVDPFEVWMRMRNARYARYRYVAYAIVAACFAFFVVATRKMKSLWLVQCLAQVFIILLSQLTGYYYTFMILSAPLTKARRSLELPILGLAILTQFVSFAIVWFDDRHALLTLVSLLFSLGMVGAFVPRTFWERLRLGSKAAPRAAGQA